MKMYKKYLKRVIVFVLLLFLLIIEVLLFVSYKVIKVTPVTVKLESHLGSQTSSQSKSLTMPIRLVVISDLHDQGFGKENEVLLEKVKEANGDIILVLGDMLNDSSESSEDMLQFLQSLVQLGPVYYGLGNHEYGYMEANGEDLVAAIESTGAIVLEKDFFDISVHGQPIRIGGLYDYAFSLDDDNTTNPEIMDKDVYSFLMEFQDTDAYKIMLAHRPDSFIFGEASKSWDIDLVVSGHLHGGQVVVPFLGGLYAGDQGFFPEYVHGLYEKDLIKILITSGLGSHKEALPRWNNPPEIMVVELEG